jgi:hypothetical protein
MLFEIDENRAIDAPLAEGKIINADHPAGPVETGPRYGGESAGPCPH